MLVGWGAGSCAWIALAGGCRAGSAWGSEKVGRPETQVVRGMEVAWVCSDGLVGRPGQGSRQAGAGEIDGSVTHGTLPRVVQGERKGEEGELGLRESSGGKGGAGRRGDVGWAEAWGCGLSLFQTMAAGAPAVHFQAWLFVWPVVRADLSFSYLVVLAKLQRRD